MIAHVDTRLRGAVWDFLAAVQTKRNEKHTVWGSARNQQGRRITGEAGERDLDVYDV